MKSKILFPFLFILFCSNMLFAQFTVMNGFFQPTGLSNQGWVAGYSAQAGPYSIWLPDSDTTVDVGGLAPGDGIGGQARFSDDGNFLCGTSQGVAGAEMSRYDHSTNQWTPIGYLGFQIDSTVSGGFAMSGDGNTVAGLSWADTTGGFAYDHAVAWNQEEGLIDLGSLFSNIGRSARANAASYDGKVIVGWQDFDGPWKSAVWRKNPAGGYFPNQYILIDSNGTPGDEFNQMGECSTVSADGNWIGGYGDFANNNEPWIWSRDSGIINLGTLPGVGTGYVSGMNTDGSIVVGWFDGMFFGDPQTPFIWTRTNGLQELNAYINNVLGYSTGTSQVYAASCLSPNGQYIAGYGIDNLSSNSFAYRLNLTPATGIHDLTASDKIKVYPNPATSLIAIENISKGILSLTGVDGRIVYKSQINGKHILDISRYESGIYFLSFQSDHLTQNIKIIKN